VVYPLPIVICPIPTGRVKLVCCAAIRGPMIGGRWHGRMCIWCGCGIMMAIRKGRRLVGEAVVDRRGGRGCDRVEEFIYGGALMGMRVVNCPGPIHR